MKSTALAPLALALLALSACGSKESGNTATAPGGSVAGKAAPAGTTWAQQIVATPEGGFRMGNPDAPIKLIEFGSSPCPHCAEFQESAHEPLERDHVNSGKVSFEYRNFIRDPLDMTVALLARCGGAEPFFPLSAQFFHNQMAMIEQIQAAGDGAYQAAMSAPAEQRFVRLAQMAGLIDFAKQRGIPEDKARQCLSDPKAAEALAAGVEKATKDFDIQGTPTLIMNGAKLENVATWPQLLERLKAAGA